MKSVLQAVGVGVLALTPVFVFAQDADLSYFTNLFTDVGALAALAVPVLITVAVAIFLFGLVRYIFAGGDEEAQKSGRSFMIWGIIVLVVAVSIWGLVAIIQNLFGVGEVEYPTPPDGPFDATVTN